MNGIVTGWTTFTLRRRRTKVMTLAIDTTPECSCVVCAGKRELSAALLAYEERRALVRDTAKSVATRKPLR